MGVVRISRACAAAAAALCLTGLAGAGEALASEVSVGYGSIGYGLFYSTSDQAANRVHYYTRGNSRVGVTAITIVDRGEVIDPATAIATGCRPRGLHKVTCNVRSPILRAEKLAADEQCDLQGGCPWPIGGGFWLVDFELASGDDSFVSGAANYPSVQTLVYCGGGNDSATLNAVDRPVDCETVVTR